MLFQFLSISVYIFNRADRRNPLSGNDEAINRNVSINQSFNCYVLQSENDLILF